jgi:chromate transporter
MQRDLVDDRRWISREDYLEGLAFSQLSPGPLAAQLAMYLGWVAGGRIAATLAGIAFVLPSFLMVLGLAALYVHFGSLSWIQGAFYGIGAAVIAIIARSAYKLVRTTLGKDQLLWVLFCGMAITTAWTESEIVWLFLLCGAITAVVKSWPTSGTGTRMTAPTIAPLMTGAHGVATAGTLWTLFGFFAKAGAFVFGSGLAIVPFLYGGVVRDFHWLTERQFLDAVAVAMITPGPVVITAAFIGYLVAGVVGSSTAALAVFAPPFFIVIIAAPYYRRFARNPQVNAFVRGVTAAAVGAIAGAAVVLGRRAIVDWQTGAIALITFVGLLVTKKIPEPLLIIGAGVLGLAIHTGTH